MKNFSQEDIVKLFGMSNQMTEISLDDIENKFDVDLGRKKSLVKKDSIYYPQFDSDIRKEAKEMCKHYEIFYCLEKTIRTLISTSLEATDADWWTNKVPPNVKTEVNGRMQREKDSGVTMRSEEPIDFTTFGELGEIIKQNWDVFGAVFNSRKAVEKVMSNLNTLRGPIAHCTKLAEDEVLRLQLSVKDWFRIMG